MRSTTDLPEHSERLGHLSPSILISRRARLERARKATRAAMVATRDTESLRQGAARVRRLSAIMQRLPRPQCALCPEWARQPAVTLVEDSPACESCAASVAEEDASHARERARRALRFKDAGLADGAWLKRMKDKDDPINHP